MLDSMEAAGIEPNATLHHFTHPQVRTHIHTPCLALSCLDSMCLPTHTQTCTHSSAQPAWMHGATFGCNPQGASDPARCH